MINFDTKVKTLTACKTVNETAKKLEQLSFVMNSDGYDLKFMFPVIEPKQRLIGQPEFETVFIIIYTKQSENIG